MAQAEHFVTTEIGKDINKRLSTVNTIIEKYRPVFAYVGNAQRLQVVNTYEHLSDFRTFGF